MDDEQFRAGERCGIEGCRSRRYRVNENGHEECENGHQHGLSQAAGQDDEDDFTGNNLGKVFRKKKAEKVKSVKSEFLAHT